MFGDALQVGTADLAMMAVISGVVLTLVTLLYHRLKLVSFDPLVAAAMGISVGVLHYLLMGMLSATVVAGLKSTGVVLVVAMVITPASAAYQLTNRFAVMLWLSALFGAVSAAVGMSVAFVFNASTGPAMVVVATVIFALAMLFSPGHGVVFDRLRRWRLARHVRNEDVLKALYRLGPLPAGNTSPRSPTTSRSSPPASPAPSPACARRTRHRLRRAAGRPDPRRHATRRRDGPRPPPVGNLPRRPRRPLAPIRSTKKPNASNTPTTSTTGWTRCWVGPRPTRTGQPSPASAGAARRRVRVPQSRNTYPPSRPPRAAPAGTIQRSTDGSKTIP